MATMTNTTTPSKLDAFYNARTERKANKARTERFNPGYWNGVYDQRDDCIQSVDGLDSIYAGGYLAGQAAEIAGGAGNHPDLDW